MRPGAIYHVTVTAPLPRVALPVDRSDFSRAGDVLGRAFHDDPQWVWLMPDPAERKVKLPVMFTGATKMATVAGGRADRSPGFEAIALWIAPGRDIGLWAFLRSSSTSARWILTPPVPDIRRMNGVMRSFDERRKELVPEPHWYLMALGTDPQHQGHGFGSALVRAGLQRAERDGTPVYLETESEINVPFYQRLGFEVIEEMTLPQFDAPFSLMIRRPV